MMKKKKRAAVEQAPKVIEQEELETSLRKSSFLRATQSDRIMILVGPSQTSFQVPQDLLMLWSPPLGEMCRAGLVESLTRRILLPHIKTSTFEDFLIWMYTYEPCVDQKNLSSVLDLAIFAEMYMICQLKNQTSDILRTELGAGRWQLTPDDVSMVYDEVPSGSILRQLCSISIAFPVIDPPSSHGFGNPNGFGSFANVASAHRQHDNYWEWEGVFERHSDLGWDYFRQIHSNYAKNAINWGGPCRFHDHRDISGMRREDVDKCPYPRGALPTERRTGSLPIEYQRELSTEGNKAPTVDEVPQFAVEEPPTVEEEPQPAEEEAKSEEEVYAPLDEIIAVEESMKISEEDLQPVEEVIHFTEKDLQLVEEGIF